MKNNIFTKLFLLLFMALGASAYGQTDKGTIMASGSASLDFNKEETQRGSQSFQKMGNANLLSVTPSVGYFFIDGLVGALRLITNAYMKRRRILTLKIPSTAFPLAHLSATILTMAFLA